MRLALRQPLKKPEDPLPEQEHQQQVRNGHQVQDPCVDIAAEGFFAQLGVLLGEHAALRAALAPEDIGDQQRNE